MKCFKIGKYLLSSVNRKKVGFIIVENYLLKKEIHRKILFYSEDNTVQY